ncbi:YggU family protein [Shewanella sp. SR43-4]|jgi:uncharacterized protein (TIGR00251 family)|uniref:UPF0235 protein ABHN84_10720 n=1 Tax=Shewanella vesiculosa TaxID=518738 RepID=A0ABV0FS24_9GAMM|nr:MULTISPECIES: DUF167 family protein YggU [Shewanella]MBB1318772.1 YggU family protein [Shewanella sp. SR43-4]MBB1321394.1 YggU family protein [Shewanella sp. SR43-8]MBB1389950.1 YggU family protein [Shewanella sp. SG44-6]MBB1474317.1 YggU family protein [Shewanella sp. SG41-3]RPA46580.1 YggU family protein [Shewanella vesiculosa]|tara:strand:+ start:6890 stop:7204 length:315 start_codon:yes stop_codon:yes gene_type:complete
MTAISYSNDEQQGDLLLFVYLQPKASRDQIIGLHGNELKIAITAPPIDGKANAHLSKYLAKACKVAKSQVHILKGEHSRHKQIQICQPQVIPAEIAALLKLTHL